MFTRTSFGNRTANRRLSFGEELSLMTRCRYLSMSQAKSNLPKKKNRSEIASKFVILEAALDEPCARPALLSQWRATRLFSSYFDFRLGLPCKSRNCWSSVKCNWLKRAAGPRRVPDRGLQIEERPQLDKLAKIGSDVDKTLQSKFIRSMFIRTWEW